jgi:hypothetical protein
LRNAKGLVGAAGIVAFWTTTAVAKPIYFHKAAVEREAFIADISECNELAGGVRMPRYNVYSPNMVSMAAGSFFAGFFGSRERRGIMENVLRTCMTDKGYRRIEASDQTRHELDELKEDARLDRLFILAAAPTPAGTVLPQ